MGWRAFSLNVIRGFPLEQQPPTRVRKADSGERKSPGRTEASSKLPYEFKAAVMDPALAA
jgi:hypothetical protein